MKILQFPSYITIDEIKEFSKNASGYGYIARDIALSLASTNLDVSVLTQSNITKGRVYKGVKIIKRTWIDIFLNFNFGYLFEAIKLIIKNKIFNKKALNILFYYISMGYFKKIMKSNNFDLIHIHGVGYYTLPIIEVCKKNNYKFIVTLHGLNSFSDSIDITTEEKNIEKLFLKEAHLENINVTVVSTGIRNVILEYLSILESNNFQVITNGFSFNSKNNSTLDIREKYDINNKKIFLCVGNISNNKNQFQIIRAFSLLPDSYQKKTVILFLGSDVTKGEFPKKILNSSHSSNLIYCGKIEREDIGIYYNQADFNITASISEGFGMPIIEGFNYGIPCVTFKDLHAVVDVYNEKAMLLVEERSDLLLSNRILDIMQKDWDRDYIKKYSKKFNLGNMADNYIKFYNGIKIG